MERPVARRPISQMRRKNLLCIIGYVYILSRIYKLNDPFSTTGGYEVFAGEPLFRLTDTTPFVAIVRVHVLGVAASVTVTKRVPDGRQPPVIVPRVPPYQLEVGPRKVKLNVTVEPVTLRLLPRWLVMPLFQVKEQGVLQVPLLFA